MERGLAKAGAAGTDEYGMDGLEAMLLHLRSQVAGGGQDGSGILARVVEFNRTLESATEALRAVNRR